MPDREKVIKGLECCADLQRGMMHRACNVCPYNDDPQEGTCVTLFPLFRDALGLLKEQEPRVLTLEETESSEDSVWLDKDIPDWEPIPVLVDDVGKYFDTFIYRSGFRFRCEKSNGKGYGDYNETWRCWSSRPTDEQREATPWTK